MDHSDLRILERRGWSDAKIEVFRSSFYEFLANCYINSKDLGGHTCLGEHLYNGQRRAIEDILDGLKNAIHDFYALKSRQLGFTTLFRAFDVFYLGVHGGLQGALVMDTDSNKKTARREIESMIENLPPHIKFPRIKSNNRDGLTLENDSTILFMAAGVKQTKSSGTLGRSVGLSLLHASEICSWDNDEGVEALRQSLSDVNPDRLYLWESTARGYNKWNEIWEEAKSDIHHSKCIFYGWWSKDSQRIDRSDPDFERYAAQPPTQTEIDRIELVKERHGVEITPEQLAWVRKKMDPTAQSDGDLPVEYEGNTIRLQEQAWLSEDAWQITGASFFAPENLKEITDKFASTKYKGYWFAPGVEFIDMKVYPAVSQQQVQLKVWNEPETDGVYVISADPAYGANEKNDRSAIQVLRCYADGCDQVAEYASPMVTSRQFAWVICALAGWYAEGNNEVYLIVELNGPGGAVWDEILSLKSHISDGYQPREIEERGLKNIFRNVRNYIYTRPDSMSKGKAWQWKMSPGSGPSGKIRLMERLRDFVSNEMLHIRSMDTLEEMQWIARDGDSIEAQGTKKDDRVVSLALGVRAWEERARKILASYRKTRASEDARKRLSIADQAKLFHTAQIEQFLAKKRIQRYRDISMLRRAAWRGR